MVARLLELFNGEGLEQDYLLEDFGDLQRGRIFYCGHAERDDAMLRREVVKNLDEIKWPENRCYDKRVCELKDGARKYEKDVEKMDFDTWHNFWERPYWSNPEAITKDFCSFSLLGSSFVSGEPLIGSLTFLGFQGLGELFRITGKKNARKGLEKVREYLAQYEGYREIADNAELVQLIPEEAKRIHRQVQDTIGSNPNKPYRISQVNTRKANQDLRKVYDEAIEEYLPRMRAEDNARVVSQFRRQVN